MRNTLSVLVAAVLLQCALPTLSLAQLDAARIIELPDGHARFEVELPRGQAYVELFVRQNGEQNVAQAIQLSQVELGKGRARYSFVRSGYQAGDRIEYRFYSYLPVSPGVFTPGPAEMVWLSHVYGGACDETFEASDQTFCLDPELDAGGALASQIEVIDADAGEWITPYSCGWYLTRAQIPTLHLPLVLDDAELLGIYVQRCGDGTWDRLDLTPYLPLSQSFSTQNGYWDYTRPDLNTIFPGTRVNDTYACGGDTVTLSTCAGPQTLRSSGTVAVRYVVRHLAN